MSGRDFPGAFAGGVAAIITSLVVAFSFPPLLPSVDGSTPLVGRTAKDAAMGGEVRFQHVRRTTEGDREAARREGALRDLNAAFGADGWEPGRFRLVMIHPLPGGLPAVESEEGAPWHLVVGPDGALEATDRGRAGRAGAPPGVPVAAAIKAFHILVPHAAVDSPLRRRAMGDVGAWLRSRLGRRVRFVFAPDVSDAVSNWPDGCRPEHFPFASENR